MIVLCPMLYRWIMTLSRNRYSPGCPVTKFCIISPLGCPATSYPGNFHAVVRRHCPVRLSNEVIPRHWPVTEICSVFLWRCPVAACPEVALWLHPMRLRHEVINRTRLVKTSQYLPLMPIPLSDNACINRPAPAATYRRLWSHPGDQEVMTFSYIIVLRACTRKLWRRTRFILRSGNTKSTDVGAIEGIRGEQRSRLTYKISGVVWQTKSVE